MSTRRILFFTTGLVTGIGISYLVASGKGRKATSKVIAMGMKLKDEASGLLESAKEEFDDMVAESKQKRLEATKK